MESLSALRAPRRGGPISGTINTEPLTSISVQEATGAAMARCSTHCIERPLRLCFQMMGAFIGSHPWWFLIAPLLLSMGLGGGFYFLKEELSNNIEEQFTPVDGQAKTERRFIQETFPGNDSMFSSLRLSTRGSFATLIATSDWNILAVEPLQDILDLDSKIRRMVVHVNQQPLEFVDVCAEVMGSCASNDLLDIIGYKANNIDAVNLTFPWYHTGLRDVPLHLSLGSVTLNNEGSVVEAAQALQLHYYLNEEDSRTTELWLESFIKLLSDQSPTHIQVTFSTSMSMQWEFEKSPSSIVSLFSITYAIVIAFSVLSCWRSDQVRTKVWVASCGVLSAALAVVSGFGVLLLLGQPFVVTAASCPFMILGIGLDDMFILISCWHRTRVLDSIPDRLADTYREAAVSISITTLTDALALFLGYSSPFGSVRAFCLYAGVSVCFCSLYSLTFLGACMAVDGRREADNKHWFTCAKISEDSPPADSKTFSACCVGGSFNWTTEREETRPVGGIYEQFYGPFLTHKLTKVCVYGIYAGYLAVSIYGCFTLKEGLDVRNLALDDSYIRKYYDDRTQHFSDFSYTVMVAVKQPFPYWHQEEQQLLLSCISKFESLNYVNSTIGWFSSFQQYTNAANLSTGSQEAFQAHLAPFLELNSPFRLDINWTADGQIQASRFFIQTLNKSTMKDMLIGLRETARECPVELLVYHPAFIYLDQYTVIKDTTVQTVLVAVLAMLLVSLLLIPSPVCSVLVAFAVCSVIVGVTGFMSLWDVSLDSISMINLVMCIGFSVDFSAHVSYAFISSSKSDSNQKARDALAHFGYPIMQGALSTILGVAVLSLSGSYLFRTFFKIMFLVICFGLMHGLVFLPVFLTVFGACWAQQ